MAKPLLDNSLKNKGYDWIAVTPYYFADALKNNKAECWMLEVYDPGSLHSPTAVYASHDKWNTTIKCYYDEKEIEITSKSD